MHRGRRLRNKQLWLDAGKAGGLDMMAIYACPSGDPIMVL
jgi:hypothetical protein